MIKLLNNYKLVARNSHRPEIILSQSVMVGLLGGLYYAASRGSIVQACTFAVTGFFTIRVPVYIRSIHLPANPTISYKSIQALVIKDRNPIGKFKQTPSAKGIVTIFITPEGLHHNDSILAHYYDEYRRNFEMKHAFSSHLDNN